MKEPNILAVHVMNHDLTLIVYAYWKLFTMKALASKMADNLTADLCGQLSLFESVNNVISYDGFTNGISACYQGHLWYCRIL